MGMTHVTVTIRNPAKPRKTWEGLFLVDTGAVDSLVPGKFLRRIGLVPRAERTYALADGSEVKMKITTGDLEFMGELVGATLIFGADDAEPILGVTALESVGIEVDPRSQKLKRLPAARLKLLRFQSGRCNEEDEMNLELYQGDILDLEVDVLGSWGQTQTLGHTRMSGEEQWSHFAWRGAL